MPLASPSDSAGVAFRLVSKLGGKLPEISGKLRKVPEASGNSRKLTEISRILGNTRTNDRFHCGQVGSRAERMGWAGERCLVGVNNLPDRGCGSLLGRSAGRVLAVPPHMCSSGSSTLANAPQMALQGSHGAAFQDERVLVPFITARPDVLSVGILRDSFGFFGVLLGPCPRGPLSPPPSARLCVQAGG